jgi:membrane fusion protein
MPTAMATKLFRQEAIDAQREKLLGEVSLARPVPLWAFTAVALAFAIGLVSFSVWGEYARRERVDGFIALDAGAARLLAPGAGTIIDILAKEGDEVRAGQPLIRLSYERGTASGATSGELVQREISERIVGLEREQQQVRLLGAQQTEILRRKIDDLQRELAQFDVEIKAQQSRLASARHEFQRAEDLYKDKFYSESKLIEFRNNVLDQQVKLESARRQRASVERELSSTRAELPTVDLKTQTQIDQIKRQMSELQQGSVQEEAKRENVIRAPISGVLTNVAANRGEAVADEAPLAVVVPKGGGLHTQLLVPTRAIGFVQPGQQVVLRYDAFPFQRFGQYHGRVERISETVWSPGEKVGPMIVREPVYRVDVKLDSQYVTLGDQKVPLRPGMSVNADILQEKRKVWEWVFEPVLALKGRLG